MQVTYSAAQVGNGRARHYVRTDAFHADTIGCKRAVRTVLTDAEAEKMTSTCKSCQKAVDAIEAQRAEAEAPAAPAPEWSRIHGLAAPFLIWGTTKRDGTFNPAQGPKATGKPVRVVDLTDGVARLDDGREVRLYTALIRYWIAAAPAAETTEAPAAEAPAPQAPAPQAPAAPTVRRFDSTADAYDWSQTDEAEDGQVLLVPRVEAVAVVMGAYPVAVTAAHGEFHRPKDTDPRTVDGGRYAQHVDHAVEVAKRLGYRLNSAVEARREAPAEAPAAPAVEVADREHCTPFGGGKVHEVIE